jgi:hypothetical protein
MNRLEQLWDYAVKVFGLCEFLEKYQDSRVRTEYQPASIIALLMCSFIARIGSLYQVERMGESWELDRLMHKGNKPSADTLGYALDHADVKQLAHYNSDIIQKARHNKVYAVGSFHGWRICAVDGAEVHSTKRPCYKALMWSKRESSNCGGKEEFFERTLAVCYVGAQPRLLLAMERILPGQGEVQAVIRTLEKL